MEEREEKSQDQRKEAIVEDAGKDVHSSHRKFFWICSIPKEYFLSADKPILTVGSSINQRSDAADQPWFLLPPIMFG